MYQDILGDISVEYTSIKEILKILKNTYKFFY
jgi:hypothetical protein